MGEVLSKWILTCIAVVIFSSLVSVIVWTLAIGYNIADDMQSDVITYYSEAGLSMIVDANNVDSIDSANLYKIMEVNRNIITDYSISNLDGSFVYDTKELLTRPLDRFSIVIEGDSSIGFEVTAQQIEGGHVE